MTDGVCLREQEIVLGHCVSEKQGCEVIHHCEWTAHSAPDVIHRTHTHSPPLTLSLFRDD